MLKKILISLFAAVMLFTSVRPLAVEAKEVYLSGEKIGNFENTATISSVNGVRSTEFGMWAPVGKDGLNNYAEFTAPKKVYDAEDGRGWLDPGDKCRVYKTEGVYPQRWYVRYPTPNGYIYKWFVAQDIFGFDVLLNYGGPRTWFANSYIQAYTTQSCSTTYGRVYPNDWLIKFAGFGNKWLIMMPLTGTNNYRICWIKDVAILA